MGDPCYIVTTLSFNESLNGTNFANDMSTWMLCHIQSFRITYVCNKGLINSDNATKKLRSVTKGTGNTFSRLTEREKAIFEWILKIIELTELVQTHVFQ